MDGSNASELYDAILAENVSIIVDIGKKHGINTMMEVHRRPTHLKGLAILPLHLAVSNRRVRSVESLLSAGADPKIRDQHGRNALHLLIAHWPYILTMGAAPRSGFRAAMAGVQQRAEACLRAICNHGVDVNTEVESHGRQTAVHLAVRYGALAAIHILAGHGAAVDATDRNGMTALHMAAGILNTEMAAGLIELGADVNKAVSQSGNSPLHLAALSAACRPTRNPATRLSCIIELLDQGAEPDAVNKAGWTALHEACSGGKEAVAVLLLRYGADVNKLTPAGESCLFLFLDRTPNVRHASLLALLLSLATPLALRNAAGLLPGALLLPRFSLQRDQLLRLARQPRSLADACRTRAFLHYGRERGGVGGGALRRLLPERLRRSVLSCWDSPCGVTFAEEGAAATPDSPTDILSLLEPLWADLATIGTAAGRGGVEH